MKHGPALVEWELPISAPRDASTSGGLTTNLLGVDRVSKRICSVPDCTKPSASKGYCKTHYNQVWRTGSIQPIRTRNAGKPCSVEGCTNTHSKRGLCGKHYIQAKSNGLLETGRTCSIDGCDTTHYGKGFCAKHYRQARSSGDIDYRPCSEDDCVKPVKAKGRCNWHHRKARMAGEFGPVPLCKEPGCEKAVEARGYCPTHFRSAAYAGAFKTVKQCSVEACDRNHYGNGLCAAHYTRVQRGNDDLTSPISDEESAYESPEAFLRVTEQNGDCLEWTGYRNPRGYGKMWDGQQKVLAYRWWYEQNRGPIPDGMELDHWCRNRACVNPDHLRACTHKQNLENLSNEGRGRSGVRGVEWSSQKQKWIVSAGHNGRSYHGGTFDTVEDAAVAARALRNRLYTHNILDRQSPLPMEGG